MDLGVSTDSVSEWGHVAIYKQSLRDLAETRRDFVVAMNLVSGSFMHFPEEVVKTKDSDFVIFLIVKESSLVQEILMLGVLPITFGPCHSLWI